MAFWSRLLGTRKTAPDTRPAAALRNPTDAAILDVGGDADAIAVRLAEGYADTAHPARGVGTALEHYRLVVTSSGMRDIGSAESAALAGRNPDMATGLTETRSFAWPLGLARDGQDYPELFDAVQTRLAVLPQPMRISAFQQVQKEAVRDVVAAMQARPLDEADTTTLRNLEGMLHWSY